MIVLDSSAAVDYLAREQAAIWVEEQLRADPDLHAPHLLDVEVAGAFRRFEREGYVTAARAQEALLDLAELRVSRYPHMPLLDRIWELRFNLSASDSAFAALAEALDADLVTTDLRLARAPGIRARIVSP